MQNNLTKDKSLGHKLVSRIDGDQFASAYWPLSLELNHLGINPTQGHTEPPLAILHNANASIIDWQAPPPVFVLEDDEEEEVEVPEFAIEDFTSDYESDEEEPEDGFDVHDPYPF